METRNTRTVAEPQFDLNYFARYSTNGGAGDDELVEQRINKLAALNAADERRKILYRSRREEIEAELMSRPMTAEKTFAYLGLLLGTFPPAAIFARVLIDARIFNTDEFWILGVLLVVNLISATVGFLTGGYIGKTVTDLERESWTKMILTLPFIGIFWGILAGGAGGILVFFFGMLPGASLGAAVGSVALPLFTVFHRLLKRGDKIEEKHFLPIAFGVSLLISAFVLGL